MRTESPYDRQRRCGLGLEFQELTMTQSFATEKKYIIRIYEKEVGGEEVKQLLWPANK